MTIRPVLATEALTGLLVPFWHFVIGGFVLLTVVVAGYRIFMRGPTRMGTALLITGGAVVCIAVLGALLQDT
jgi:zinc transporter ZupT